MVRLYQLMAQTYQNAPRGEARREAILRATLDVIAAHGTDGVTHRAIAAARRGAALRHHLLVLLARRAARGDTALRRARGGRALRRPRARARHPRAHPCAAGPRRSRPRWPESSTPTGRASWRCSSSRSRPRAGPRCARGATGARHPPPARRDGRPGGRLGGPPADAPIIVAAVSGLMFEQLAAPRTGLRARPPAPRARAPVRAPGGRRRPRPA